MLIQRAADIPSSEITPERAYQNRRQFIKAALMAPGIAAIQTSMPSDNVTPYQFASTYNNYYEFGADRSDPSKNSAQFRTRPWTVSVEGLVKKPTHYDLDDLLKGVTPEDRTYRILRRALVHGDPLAGYPACSFDPETGTATVGQVC